MAKILCALSGVEFKVEHFPVYLTSRECAHPVFSIKQKKLLGYAGKWAANELTPTDSYLLFLALLHSTELVEFRVPAIRDGNTDSLVANNMEDLLKAIGRINLISHPNFALPRFVISPETKTLETVHYWIAAWESCYEDFCSGNKAEKLKQSLSEREEAIEKLIRNPQVKPTIYANALANWAELAGNFPHFTESTNTPFGQVSICDYWKAIIRKCANAESIFSVPKQDLQELIEHCEDNILHGSIFAHALMKLLREGLTKQNNFLGLGDYDVSSLSGYRILSEDDSTEKANKLALIDSAPDHQPKLSEYPTKIAYLKAKAKWDMKLEHQKETQEAAQGTLNTRRSTDQTGAL